MKRFVRELNKVLKRRLPQSTVFLFLKEYGR